MKRSSYKVGQTMYEACANETTGKVEINEWRVRTIRKDRVTCIYYCLGVTWVKLSPKAGHYGWDKKLDPIFRRTFMAESPTLCRTKKEACKDELKFVRQGYVTDDPQVQATLERTLRSMISRHSISQVKGRRPS